MSRTKVIRLSREHVERCAALAARFPDVTTGDMIARAIDFHTLAFTTLAEAQKQAGREVSLDLSPRGLLQGFVEHVAAVGALAAQPDPEAIRLAATIPGATPQDVSRFAVDLFCRVLTVTDEAGLSPRKPARMTPDDVLERFAKAVTKQAFSVTTQPERQSEIEA